MIGNVYASTFDSHTYFQCQSPSSDDIVLTIKIDSIESDGVNPDCRWHICGSTTGYATIITNEFGTTHAIKGTFKYSYNVSRIKNELIQFKSFAMPTAGISKYTLSIHQFGTHGVENYFGEFNSEPYYRDPGFSTKINCQQLQYHSSDNI